MTYSFLEEQAKARGVTVSEMMSERSKKADKTKTGFASLTPEQRKAVAALGGKAGKGRKREKS